VSYKFNSYVDQDDLKQCSKEIDYLISVGYGDLNFDAIYKWAVILNTIEEIGLNSKKCNCIEVGGGLSPIPLILSNKHIVTDVDIQHNATWFPIKKVDKIYNKAKLEFNKDNIKYIKSKDKLVGQQQAKHRFGRYIGMAADVKIINKYNPYCDYFNSIEDNTVDFICDTSSRIHLLNDKVTILNEMYRVLKPGGYIIMVSDVSHPNSTEFKDPLNGFKDIYHRRRIVELYNESGFTTWLGEDWELDSFFSDNKNFHYPMDHFQRGHKVRYKNTQQACDDKCSKSPTAHLLCEYGDDDRGGMDIIRARFLFRKPTQL